MKLTEHQQQRLAESIEILRRSKRLLIKGSAGVGKTFMVDALISQISQNYRGNIYCSAPTNKAVAVLKSKVTPLGRLAFVTTHSALRLKRSIDNKTGNVSFKPSYDKGYPPLKDVGLFIIDESSMVSKELLGYIEKYAGENNTTVIFIGDDKQLNPVNEEDSPVFLAEYPSVELTEIVRQKGGNPIIDLSRNLALIGSLKANTNEIGGYVYTYNEQKVVQALAEVNGKDDLKFLGYTNAEVDRINRLTREIIYGKPKKIEKGETLIFNSPLGEDYYTNQEIFVEKLMVIENEFGFMSNKDGIADYASPNSMFGKIKLKCYSINPVHIEKTAFSDEEWRHKILVIHEDSQDDFNALEKRLKQKAKIGEISWVNYFEFMEIFADLSYNHAITVHKSQGSTFKQAIVNISNLNINRNTKEKQRLLYTAVTRASELLILYNA